MGNMGYCRFQNTVSDLRDCLDNLFDDEIEEDEQKARKNLIKICKLIVNNTEGEE